MKTKLSRKVTRVFLIILVFLFALSPFSLPQNIFRETSRARAYEEITISGYEEWTTDREIDGYVLIESGGTLVIKNGVTVTFKGGSLIEVRGKLVSKGTRNNPVKFQREGVDEIPVDEYGDVYEYEGYSFDIYGEANFINSEISGGGNIAQYVLKNNFINKAYAYGASGVIQVLTNRAKLTIDGCNFHNNIAGIYLNRATGSNIKVNRTLFNDNVYFDENDSNLQGSIYPDFRYNWWRNPNGPETTGDTYNPYKYISKNINKLNWLTQEDFHDPVIIIPGILGSEKVDGDWQMDPIFHTYDDLYAEFSNNGYTPDQDLFTFPYEWRISNVENANLLRAKINAIKQQRNWPKVDLVAHSMGGLLAREYIESVNYQDDVDQLVTLGTPHNGAPEAYLKWEAGAFAFSIADIYLKHRFSQEAEENDYDDNIFHYIQDKIPSVKELLPTYGYLYDVENDDDLIPYNENNYPINTFLESLNSSSRKAKLLQVELDKVIGKVNDDSSTVAGFNVIKKDMGEYWIHGYPHGFEIPLIGDGGMINSYGDQTVPLESARSVNIPADTSLELDSVHRYLPTDAQKSILKILTGVEPSGEVRRNPIKDILIVLVHSPIDIQVIGPNGRVGKDFETGGILNEIPGSFYSGYGTENEFLTIPISNSKDGDEYQILTQGTEDGGSYRIEVARISEQENSPEAEDPVVIIEGTAQAGIIDYDNKVEIAGDKVVNPDEQDNVAPVITITSPKTKDYLNNEMLPINFTVSDIKSAPDHIATEITLDGKIINGREVDLSLEHLKNHTLKITAKDEAQNPSEEEIIFQVIADADSIIDNIEHYAALGMIRDKLEKKILTAELKKIEILSRILEEAENNSRIPKRIRAKIIEVAAKCLNHQIELAIKHIQKKPDKAISRSAKGLLIESLEFIKK